MTSKFSRMIIAALACLAFGTPAFAHAFLDRAVPGVGTTVGTAPPELSLTFTENIVPAFSGVAVTNANGAPITTGRASFGPANTMHVRLSRPIGTGTYIVSWHVVSVDTHRTHGTYKFTIAP